MAETSSPPRKRRRASEQCALRISKLVHRPARTPWTDPELYRHTTATCSYGQPVAFLEDFVTYLSDTSEQRHHQSTQYIYQCYQQYVKLRVGHRTGCCEEDVEEEVVWSRGEHYFYKALVKISVGKFTRGKRGNNGYYVQVSNRYLQYKPDLSRVLPPPDVPLSLIKVLFCHPNRSTKRDTGAFATVNLPANQTLCEYRGRRLSCEEGRKKAVEYAAMKLPVTMLYCTEGEFCIDGHAHETVGEEFGQYENVAVLLNDTKHNPNCVLVVVGAGEERKYFLRTRREVAAGFELVWSHGDKEDGFIFV